MARLRLFAMRKDGLDTGRKRREGPPRTNEERNQTRLAPLSFANTVCRARLNTMLQRPTTQSTEPKEFQASYRAT